MQVSRIDAVAIADSRDRRLCLWDATRRSLANVAPSSPHSVNSANPRDVGPRSIKGEIAARVLSPVLFARASLGLRAEESLESSFLFWLFGWPAAKNHLSVGSINDPTAILHGRGYQPLKAFLGESMPMQNAVREFC